MWYFVFSRIFKKEKGERKMDSSLVPIVLVGIASVGVFLICLFVWATNVDICLSCGEMFYKEYSDCFCKIGKREIYFCESCTGSPWGRLSVNRERLKEEGFNEEEINELETAIHLYKN